MKRTAVLSCFLFLVNCATAISQELMCRHYDAPSFKYTKYAWFELRLDEVQTDKNFILWQRELDVESGKQSEPNVKLPAIYISSREVFASTTRMIDLTHEQGKLYGTSPMFYSIHLDLVTGDLALYRSITFQKGPASLAASVMNFFCDLKSGE